jgi:hypothetical protein
VSSANQAGLPVVTDGPPSTGNTCRKWRWLFWIALSFSVFLFLLLVGVAFFGD